MRKYFDLPNSTGDGLQTPATVAPLSTATSSEQQVNESSDPEQPVSVTTKLENALTTYQIPSAPGKKLQPDALSYDNKTQTQTQTVSAKKEYSGPVAWIPANKTVVVAGLSIPGMVYVGVPAYANGNDPCIIDTSKSVAPDTNNIVPSKSAWPNYSELCAPARRAYLEWLADAKKDPNVNIDYVFLYFYGLERRVFVDHSKSEWPSIATELRRLLSIYGDKSKSFSNCANLLLDWIWLSDVPQKLYLQPVPSFPPNTELPLYIRVALGQVVTDGIHLPAQLALAWVRNNPSDAVKFAAVPYVREFELAFNHIYHTNHDSGLILEGSAFKIKLTYHLTHRLARSNFSRGENPSITLQDTPDISGHKQPLELIRKMAQTAKEVVEPLEKYMKNNPDGSAVLGAILHLPQEIWSDNVKNILLKLQEDVQKDILVIPFIELLSRLTAKGSITQNETLILTFALRSFNIGVEPSIVETLKRIELHQKIALFEIPKEAPPDSDGNLLDALALDYVAAVAFASNEYIDEKLKIVETQIKSWPNLTVYRTAWLQARLRLRFEERTPSAVLKSIRPVNKPANDFIDARLMEFIKSYKKVSTLEITVLEKIQKALRTQNDDVLIQATEEAMLAREKMLEQKQSKPTTPTAANDSTLKPNAKTKRAASPKKKSAEKVSPKRESSLSPEFAAELRRKLKDSFGDTLLPVDDRTSIKAILNALGITPESLLSSLITSIIYNQPPELKPALKSEPKSKRGKQSKRVAASDSQAAQEQKIKLDFERIAALEKDSANASALLSDIFSEQETVEQVVAVPQPKEKAPADNVHSLLGLDRAHSELARLLLSRSEWTKEQLNEVAAKLDLMLDGALEILNDAAFDEHDMPFIEGEEIVKVTPELLSLYSVTEFHS
jgi:hypothetical protein